MTAAAAAEPLGNRDSGNHKPNGQFAPGNRANPGGRPKKIAELSQAVRDMLAPAELAQMLIGVVMDPKQKTGDRLEAARILADRGWGKAVDFKPEADSDPLGLSDAEQAAERFRAEVLRLAGSDAPAQKRTDTA